MTAICMYFQVHQPERLGNYGIFDIGKHQGYFDERKNREVMQKVAKKCYLPANKTLLDNIKKHKGKFRISFSITGTAMEQFERYAPEVLDSFKALAQTGCVEFLAETYYHSLSFIYSKEEFKAQVKKHGEMIKKHFGQKPKVFRNTELIYNNELAMHVQEMGYKGILAEGWDHVLGWRSPNFVYSPHMAPKLKLLLKNYKLSDDIAFRFGNKGWAEHPLTADKFAAWVSAIQGDTINLFMDYETFGEHQWEDTGIFDFMFAMPEQVLNYPHMEFKTPSELLKVKPKDKVDVHHFVSWADTERDLSAWKGNALQDAALAELYKMEKKVKESGNEELLQNWRLLTTSDHFYYMCIKWFNDGDVHKYFNPYDSPYDAYISFMNVLNDMAMRLNIPGEEPNINITENPSMILN